MYFKKISLYDLSTPSATVFKNKKTDDLFFNLRLGITGEKTWEYILLFDKRKYIPKDANDKLELDGVNYNIKPIKDKLPDNKFILKKDGKGNVQYVVSEDSSSFHKKDLILIWELPNRNFTNIKYEIKGPHNILAEAVTGKERSENIYTSPIILAELLGDCDLKWEGIQDTGDILEQSINFKYETGQFTINLIKTKGE
jgi:hypothetical protein